MKPINNKSLLHFLFNQMEKFDRGEITEGGLKAQAAMAKQVNNAFNYEIKRAETLIKIKQHNKETGDTLELREIEGTNF